MTAGILTNRDEHDGVAICDADLFRNCNVTTLGAMNALYFE
jgi:hypothetical protein